MNGIKSMYVDSSACVRIKRGVSEQFRIESRVRQEFIMSPWLFNVYMDGVMKEVKMGMGGLIMWCTVLAGMGNGSFGKERRRKKRISGKCFFVIVISEV